MTKEKIRFYGEPAAGILFLQMTGALDEEHMEREKRQLRKLSGRKDWCIAAVPVDSWNQDLSPWEAAPVFGEEGFGDGAEATLQWLLSEVLPWISEAYPAADRKYVIAGYSLAGLFSLYAGYRTKIFSGAVAASPSVWFPGWRDYIRTHAPEIPCVYLSLGTKEDKTRNPVMSQVGEAIRVQEEALEKDGCRTVLEWNPGNHFIDSDIRTAKGMARMLEMLSET